VVYATVRDVYTPSKWCTQLQERRKKKKKRKEEENKEEEGWEKTFPINLRRRGTEVCLLTLTSLHCHPNQPNN
jgi:hypothetical protein